MAREIETGPLLAAAGAVLLLVSLFLDWYGGFSGWNSFEALDLVLAALALAATVPALRLLGADLRVPARALPWIGAVAVVIVGSQVLNHPPLGIEREMDAGPWIALLGAALILLGGFIAVARVSLAVQVREREAAARAAAGGPSAPGPAVPGGAPYAPAPAPAPPAPPAPAPAPAPPAQPPHGAAPTPEQPGYAEPASPAPPGESLWAGGEGGPPPPPGPDDPTTRLGDGEARG